MKFAYTDLKEMVKKFIRRHKYGLLLMIPGAIAGYLYWKHIGCNSGTCPITSVWYNSAIYGTILGYLLGGLADDAKARKKTKRAKAVENSK